VKLPEQEHDAPYLMLRLRTLSETEPNWRKAVDVFLRAVDCGYEVVGIDREI